MENKEFSIETSSTENLINDLETLLRGTLTACRRSIISRIIAEMNFRDWCKPLSGYDIPEDGDKIVKYFNTYIKSKTITGIVAYKTPVIVKCNKESECDVYPQSTSNKRQPIYGITKPSTVVKCDKDLEYAVIYPHAVSNKQQFTTYGEILNENNIKYLSISQILEITDVLICTAGQTPNATAWIRNTKQMIIAELRRRYEETIRLREKRLEEFAKSYEKIDKPRQLDRYYMERGAVISVINEMNKSHEKNNTN